MEKLIRLRKTAFKDFPRLGKGDRMALGLMMRCIMNVRRFYIRDD